MRGSSLTKEQRETLLHAYRDKGFQAAKPLAISFGIAPRYVARLARENGITGNYFRGQLGVMATVKKQKYIDKRWKIAIERGAVTA